MNFRDIKVLYAMELRSALRERAIVVNSILMPIFLYPVLLWVIFSAMMFIQGLTFFWRSMLEFIEGESSAGKYLQLDELNDETAETAAAAH